MFKIRVGRGHRFIFCSMKNLTTHLWYGCIVCLYGTCVEGYSYVCKWIRSPSAKGYITLKIILIIFSPSSVSQGFHLPLSFVFFLWFPLPHPMLSVFVLLCYISATALGSLGETVKGVFHREKHRLRERLGKHSGGSYWQSEFHIMKYFFLSFYMTF